MDARALQKMMYAIHNIAVFLREEYTRLQTLIILDVLWYTSFSDVLSFLSTLEEKYTKFNTLAVLIER